MIKERRKSFQVLSTTMRKRDTFNGIIATMEKILKDGFTDDMVEQMPTSYTDILLLDAITSQKTFGRKHLLRA